jgi:hypothetical protein
MPDDAAIANSPALPGIDKEDVSQLRVFAHCC